MGKIDWIETENPEVRFENNAIGRIKKEVWDADEAQLDKWLKEDFEIPSPFRTWVSMQPSGSYFGSHSRIFSSNISLSVCEISNGPYFI